MKTTSLLAVFPFAFLATCSAEAQDTFQNLNFESANTGSLTFAFSVPVSSALPAWTVSIGGVQQSGVGYNAPSGGAPSVWLLGPGYGPTGFVPIDGNYSVVLQAGFLNGVTPTTPSITQSGVVPLGSESLEFKAWQNSSALTVSFDGNNLSPVVEGGGPNYTLYAVDISAYAGQTGQLDFTALFPQSGLGALELDDISFSTNSIAPEPNIVALTAIAGLLFGTRKWFARR